MWHWHLISSAKNESLWQERLTDIPNAVLSHAEGVARIEIDIYWETQEEALLFQACHGGDVCELAPTDWVAATAPENQPPLMIRQQLVISSSDKAEQLAELQAKYPKRIILSFPAEMAFGTGDHATTSTCLRMLCDYAKEHQGEKWRLTDIGCGTGVLALAGLRLGAQSALSFDFDPIAVEVAARNHQRNGAPKNIKLFQADVFEWKPAKQERAELVLANLFATVLQKAFSPHIVSAIKPGGTLIISGILNTQADETLACAAQAGLVLQKRVNRGKWTTAQLQLPA